MSYVPLTIYLNGDAASEGVTTTLDDLRAYSNVSSLVGAGSSSLESISGADLSEGTIILINTYQGIEWVASIWRAVKPATAQTDLSLGIVRLLDDSVHLVKTGGL